MSTSTRPPGRPSTSTRDRMLDAAAQVLRTRGLARATTKEIARAAHCSEAALYKYFQDKTDLFLAVLAERVPSNLGALLTGLDGRAGQGVLRDTLREIAGEAIRFYRETFPIAASLFSSPHLLDAHRRALRERDTGPHVPVVVLAGYLAAERAAGALRADADPDATAALLLGACLQRAFLDHFADPRTGQRARDGDAGDAGDGDAGDAAFVAALVRTLLDGVAQSHVEGPPAPDSS